MRRRSIPLRRLPFHRLPFQRRLCRRHSFRPTPKRRPRQRHRFRRLTNRPMRRIQRCLPPRSCFPHPRRCSRKLLPVQLLPMRTRRRRLGTCRDDTCVLPSTRGRPPAACFFRSASRRECESSVHDVHTCALRCSCNDEKLQPERQCRGKRTALEVRVASHLDRSRCARQLTAREGEP